MWYVKDEFTNKIYLKDEDVRKTQAYANRYNNNYKFCGQRMFKFNLYTFAGICLFGEEKIDVNGFTKKWSIFTSPTTKYEHPLSIKNFNKKHEKYITKKLELIKKICKKYHLWSYNGKGRKCDGFDF